MNDAQYVYGIGVDVAKIKKRGGGGGEGGEDKAMVSAQPRVIL